MNRHRCHRWPQSTITVGNRPFIKRYYDEEVYEALRNAFKHCVKKEDGQKDGVANENDHCNMNLSNPDQVQVGLMTQSKTSHFSRKSQRPERCIETHILQTAVLLPDATWRSQLYQHRRTLSNEYWFESQQIFKRSSNLVFIEKYFLKLKK